MKDSSKWGTPLVVQGLRLCAPSAEGQVRSLIRELDPTCCNQRFLKSQLKDPAYCN